MEDVTPAQQALVSEPSTCRQGRGSHDALKQVEGPTGCIHESGESGSTDHVSRSSSLTEAAIDILNTTTSDPLAATASSSMSVGANEHPLSPDISLPSINRTSYFRSAILPGISPVSDVIFPEENEDKSDSDDVNKHSDAQSGIPAETVRRVSQPSLLQDEAAEKETSLTTTIRLPRTPHNLSVGALDEHLRSVLPNDLRGVVLAQELSRQLERTERELRDLRALQEARENSLIALLRETGSISESLINRTLVRAKVEAGETSCMQTSDNQSWKIQLPATGSAPSKPAARVSL